MGHLASIIRSLDNALTPAEKRRIFEIVIEETAGRVPVYAGTGAITTREVIALNKIAEQAGIDAV